MRSNHFLRIPIIRGFGWSIYGAQIILYRWGISLYVPWRRFPTVQIGQMDAQRGVWKLRRIGPTHVHGFLFWLVYFCIYWPEKQGDSRRLREGEAR